MSDSAFPIMHPASSSVETTGSGLWVGLFGNRAAGRGNASSRVERLGHALQSHGLEFRPVWTPQERWNLIDQANRDPNCRALVAAGGDGTVASVIQERPQVPLAVLPAGTENLFAQHAGLGKRPEEIAKAIAMGQNRHIDLGQVVGGPRFSLMTGFGFDGDIISRHHQTRLDQSGEVRPTHRAAYVEPVLRSTVSYSFPPIQVKVDDGPQGPECLVGTTVFVFNLPRYALGLPFAPSARDDDGFLDLILFRKPGPFHALRYLWLVFRGLHLRRRGVEHRVVRRVSISVAETAVPVQVDGDPGGILEPKHPWTIEAVPGALSLIVPPKFH